MEYDWDKAPKGAIYYHQDSAQYAPHWVNSEGLVCTENSLRLGKGWIKPEKPSPLEGIDYISRLGKKSQTLKSGDECLAWAEEIDHLKMTEAYFIGDNPTDASGMYKVFVSKKGVFFTTTNFHLPETSTEKNDMELVGDTLDVEAVHRVLAEMVNITERLKDLLVPVGR